MEKEIVVADQPKQHDVEEQTNVDQPQPEAESPSSDTKKHTSWDKLWPVIACGACLFSDGYLNGVIGSVSTMLSLIYPDQYTNNPAQSNVSSITFAGTLIGNLLFGWTSDHWSRKGSLSVSTIIIIVFAALSTGSYGANGSVSGLFEALTAWRFFLGIGIGGEYPAGSVGCAESTVELKSGTRQRWFILFTNVQIDFGFVLAAFVPMIVVLITGESHLRAAWRICLGLGIIPPLSLLYLRLELDEPETFKSESMARTKTPWTLCIRFYWRRLTVVSTIWLLYNFSSYAFSIFSSQIITNLLRNESSLWVSFGWNTLLTLFYMPGCISGAWLSDWIGPKKALGYAVLVQGCVGFIMAGCYSYLYQPHLVAAFVVVYGIFIALGELGAGDNIGLIASKTCATAVRGKYYGVAAAWGRVGAYVGSKSLVFLYNDYAVSDPIKAGQYPFFIASALCIVSAAIALGLLPHIGQDTIELEDARFRAYLEGNGYDVGSLGLRKDEREDDGYDSTLQRKPET